MRADAAHACGAGLAGEEAARCAGYRIFGSKPGAYGAGLQALIDERLLEERGRSRRAPTSPGAAMPMARGAAGRGASATCSPSASTAIEAVVQNQDNREHDLLDFGRLLPVRGRASRRRSSTLAATGPAVYHNDHSRPERPVIRTLEEEIAPGHARPRVVNPKWIAGVMRHGYKGAFEIAATVDYMFAFAATTGAVQRPSFRPSL